MRPVVVVSLCSLLSAAPLAAAVKGVVLSPLGAPLKATVIAYAPESSAAAAARVNGGTPRKELARATVDDSGAFSLDLKEKIAVVNIAADGYAPHADLIANDDDLGVIMLRSAAMKSGRVTAAGKPVANALVRVADGGGFIEVLAKTDEAGRYSVADPNTWAATLTVQHPDFAFVRVNAGPARKFALDVALDPGVAIRGKVVAEDGKTPAANAEIRVDGVRSATSADDGTFEIAHAPRAWREVSAIRADRVAAKTRASGDIFLRLAKAGVVSGVVRDGRTQKPLPGTLIRLLSGGDGRMMGAQPELASTTADANGAFSFSSLLPGTYRVTARYPNEGFSTADASVRAGESVTKTLSGTALGRVAGRVVDESRNAVPLARVTVSPIAQQNGPFRMMAGGDISAVSAPDGRFIVRNVRPDAPFDVTAEKRGRPEAKAAALKVQAGETKRDVVLTIPAGVHLTGRVIDRDGRPIAGVKVRSSESEQGGGMRMVIFTGASDDEDLPQTDREGKFDLQVVPGTYDLSFAADGFATQRQRRVKVVAGAEPLEVTLQPGVEIAGRVVRSTGEGVADVMVNVLSDSGPVSASPITTAADGSFVVPNLAPGSYNLMFGKIDEMVREMRSATAPTSNLTITLQPTTTVEGRVTDRATGQPIREFRAGISGDRSNGMMMMRAPTNLRDFHTDDGRFVLDKAPEGSVGIVVDAPGYVRRTVSGIETHLDKPTTGVEIALEPGVRLTGRVTSPEGEPLEGVSVNVEEESDGGFRGRMMPMMSGPPTMTDASGQYTIEGQAAGDRVVSFSKSGYGSERKSAKLAGPETRLDARLSRGLTLAGIVVTDAGSPVADAHVSARSSSSQQFLNTTTDSNGAFRFEGVSEGRYVVSSEKTGLVAATTRDVDPASGTAVRLTMGSGGTVVGHVRGLTADEMATAWVTVASSKGEATGAVDASGAFRVEGVPAGTVHVQAEAGAMRNGRSSESETVQVQAGEEVNVDIDFTSDVVVTGRVTHNGEPVEGATVRFASSEPGSNLTATGQSTSDGNYEVRGLKAGKYDVFAVDMRRFGVFRTTYEATSSGRFDIDMKGQTIRGTVVDADTSDPLSDVTVTIVPTENTGRRVMRPELQTNSAGGFSYEGLEEGTYRVTAVKTGYGEASQTIDVSSSTPDISLKLTKADGAVIKVVDARDHEPLSAWIRVIDASGATTLETNFRPRPDGTIKVPLSAGQHTLRVWTPGYAPATASVAAPSSGTSIALLQGGTLTLNASGSDRRTAKLIDGSGQPFRPFFGDGTLVVNPGTETVEHITAGSYTLQLFDSSGALIRSTPVTINEGQNTNVSL